MLVGLAGSDPAVTALEHKQFWAQHHKRARQPRGARKRKPSSASASAAASAEDCDGGAAAEGQPATDTQSLQTEAGSEDFVDSARHKYLVLLHPHSEAGAMPSGTVDWLRGTSISFAFAASSPSVSCLCV